MPAWCSINQRAGRASWPAVVGRGLSEGLGLGVDVREQSWCIIVIDSRHREDWHPPLQRMTNLRFTLLLARSGMLLALTGVLLICLFDYLESNGGFALHPLAKIGVTLVGMIVPYRWYSRELVIELERRTKLWRAKAGDSE